MLNMLLIVILLFVGIFADTRHRFNQYPIYDADVVYFVGKSPDIINIINITNQPGPMYYVYYVY